MIVLDEFDEICYEFTLYWIENDLKTIKERLKTNLEVELLEDFIQQIEKIQTICSEIIKLTATPNEEGDN